MTYLYRVETKHGIIRRKSDKEYSHVAYWIDHPFYFPLDADGNIQWQSGKIVRKKLVDRPKGIMEYSFCATPEIGLKKLAALRHYGLEAFLVPVARTEKEVRTGS